MAKINAKVTALFKGEAEVTAEAVQVILDEVQASSLEKIEKLKADLAAVRKDPSKANQCLETATVGKQSYRFKQGISKFKVPMRILPEGFKPEGMNAAGEITAEDAIQCKELMTALVKVGAGIIEEA